MHSTSPGESLSAHAAAASSFCNTGGLAPRHPIWGDYQARHGLGLHSAECGLWRTRKPQFLRRWEPSLPLPHTEPPGGGHGATGQAESARDRQVGQPGPGSEERPTPSPVGSLQTHRHYAPHPRPSWLCPLVPNAGQASRPIYVLRLRVAPGHWKHNGSG